MTAALEHLVRLQTALTAAYAVTTVAAAVLPVVTSTVTGRTMDRDAARRSPTRAERHAGYHSKKDLPSS